MKSFILHHLPLILQQIHAQFQMLPFIHIHSHNRIIRTIEQDLPEQLNTLPLGHITLTPNQNRVIPLKEGLEIDSQELRSEIFVPGEQVAESAESVGASLERSGIDPVEEPPEDSLRGCRSR